MRLRKRCVYLRSIALNTQHAFIKQRDARQQRCKPRHVRGLGEHRVEPRIERDLAQAVVGIGGIERHIGRARTQHAEYRCNQSGRARHCYADATLAGSCANTQAPLRNARRPCIEFAIRYRHVYTIVAGKADCDSIGSHPGLCFDARGHGLERERGRCAPGIRGYSVERDVAQPSVVRCFDPLSHSIEHAFEMRCKPQHRILRNMRGVPMPFDPEPLTPYLRRRPTRCSHERKGQMRAAVGIHAAQTHSLALRIDSFVERIVFEYDEAVEERTATHSRPLLQRGERRVLDLAQFGVAALKRGKPGGDGCSRFDIDGQRQAVDEEPDDGLRRGQFRRPPRHGGAEHHLAAPRKMREHKGPGRLYKRVERDLRTPRRTLGTCVVHCADFAHDTPGLVRAAPCGASRHAV
ncbi:hypothetical protein JCM10599A_36720 [Paraburkholderia kururiensis]